MKTELVFTKHVPLPDHEKSLVANPHAKCFREIKISVLGSFTTFRLCTVGKEAAKGGFRATPVDVREVQVPTELFNDESHELLSSTALGKEPWVVGTAISGMRNDITSSALFTSFLTKSVK